MKPGKQYLTSPLANGENMTDECKRVALQAAQRDSALLNVL